MVNNIEERLVIYTKEIIDTTEDRETGTLASPPFVGRKNDRCIPALLIFFNLLCNADIWSLPLTTICCHLKI